MRITKQQRTQTAQAIIDRNKLDVPFDDYDTKQLNEVLETSFDGFIRRRNPQFASDYRHLHGMTFGEYEAFSWRKAISPRSDLQEIKKTMRGSVLPCIKEFMDSQDEPACEHCGTTERLTVDHNPSFDSIALDYMAQYGVPRTVDSPDGVGDMFADIDVEARWISFHQSKITRYAILCRSCNASKGTTAAVRKVAA